MKRVAYIILNYKTYQDTIRVTNEILSFGKENDIVLIVDNCSPNESSSVLHSIYDDVQQVDVIDSEENGGYAKGNNYGLRYIKKFSPRFVCIMNNDVHFTVQMIDDLCKVYDILDNPALIAPIQMLPNGERAQFVEFKVPDLFYDIRMNSLFLKPKFQKYASNTKCPYAQRVGYLPGALLFSDYSVIESLGFFDESTFLFCEERFIGKKIQRKGLNNYIILNLSYVHEHSKTIRNEASLKRQRQLVHEGRLKYYDKYSIFPFIAKTILNLSFYFHEFEILVLSYVRKIQ